LFGLNPLFDPQEPQWPQWELRKKLRHSSVRNPRLLTPLYLSFTSVSFRNGVKIFGKDSKGFIPRVFIVTCQWVMVSTARHRDTITT
jgi:hypothetical protein